MAIRPAIPSVGRWSLRVASARSRSACWRGDHARDRQVDFSTNVLACSQFDFPQLAVRNDRCRLDSTDCATGRSAHPARRSACSFAATVTLSHHFPASPLFLSFSSASFPSSPRRRHVVERPGRLVRVRVCVCVRVHRRRCGPAAGHFASWRTESPLPRQCHCRGTGKGGTASMRIETRRFRIQSVQLQFQHHAQSLGVVPQMHGQQTVRGTADVDTHAQLAERMVAAGGLHHETALDGRMSSRSRCALAPHPVLLGLSSAAVAAVAVALSNEPRDPHINLPPSRVPRWDPIHPNHDPQAPYDSFSRPLKKDKEELAAIAAAKQEQM